MAGATVYRSSPDKKGGARGSSERMRMYLSIVYRAAQPALFICLDIRQNVLAAWTPEFWCFGPSRRSGHPSAIAQLFLGRNSNA